MKGVSMVWGENASARVNAVGSVSTAAKNCQKVANDCRNNATRRTFEAAGRVRFLAKTGFRFTYFYTHKTKLVHNKAITSN